MKRAEQKRRNADFQRSYSLERAYLQGWNEADGSHWREPKEDRPTDETAVYLVLLNDNVIYMACCDEGEFRTVDGIVTEKVVQWMELPMPKNR